MGIRHYPGSTHGHTEYSNLRLRDSIIKIDQAMTYAEELGHELIGFTDHEFVGSWIKVEKAAANHPKLKVIYGNEIYLCRNGLTADNFIKGRDEYYHFILLAKNEAGAEQIRQISTRAWKRSYMARGMRRVPTYYQDLFDIIGKNPGHVIAQTACLGGSLPTQLLRWRDNQSPEFYEKIRFWCRQMNNLFGQDNFFLELQPSENEEQTFVNRNLIKLSHDLNIPFIITTDSHYLKKEDAPLHAAYLNAQDGEREVSSFYATTYMMSTEELESHMDLTEEELETAYNNIRKIGKQCENFSNLRDLHIPRLIWREPPISEFDENLWYSRIPMLKTFMESDYEGDRILALHVVGRLSKDEELNTQEMWNALEDNLNKTWESSIVNKAHWSAYFLNLQKNIDVCWEAGTVVGCGRGSGIGFVLLYILDIIQINCLREKVQTYSFRFLNPSRVSVLDCDTDIEGGRRNDVLNAFRKTYGADRVANVATFRCEKPKAAILTACRGLEYNPEVGQYLSSLIPVERGESWTLQECMYGNEEKGRAPVKQFVVEMTQQYANVWEMASKIEGIVCGYGIHAGGVIFVDEPFEKSTALMRAPDGTIITQFDLHDDEAASLIKIDLLSVEAADKIHVCLDLLCNSGYIERKPTLRETYESAIGIYNLERKAPEMWEMIWEHKINSLFQMEKESGIKGIALTKPKSVEDLAHLNSIIRLMAQEKGGEMPIDKYTRFKGNIQLWHKEMDDYGLTTKEKQILIPVLSGSYGICESQESFMQLVQIPECGGFDLNFADKLRKSIAKKSAKDYEELTKKYFETVKEKGLSEKLCNYVWNVLIATSRGYGFNLSHTLAYSLVALQEMNLAYRFPTIFWNTACLITDAGGTFSEDDEEEKDEEKEEDIVYDSAIEDFVDDKNEDDEDEEGAYSKTTSKKKQKALNYGKIAAALGKAKANGIVVTPPNINKSSFTFLPDPINNTIIYGLSGIAKINEDIIKLIMSSRPFVSFEDFTKRVPLTKPQMFSLIKSGAFDDFGERREIMKQYVGSVSDTKKRITLQNLQALVTYGLIPDEFDFERRIFNYNKYLKKAKDGAYYKLDNIAFAFWGKNLSIDDLAQSDSSESGFKVLQATWDKQYKKIIDRLGQWIKTNSTELLTQLNNCIIQETWDKYCDGSYSKWEMDSVSFYSHPHELANVDNAKYGFADFQKLPETPHIARQVPTRDGKLIPLFDLTRICGTVLSRDKNKKTIVLLTTTGVVNVKIFGALFAQYDRRISEVGADGKKHIIQGSMFERGNKIAVCGVREGDSFRAKKYKNTPWHLCEQINGVDEDGNITFGERFTEGEGQ